MNNDRDWHKEGLCSGHPDPDLWHYENSRIPDEQQLQVLRSIEAIEICNTCPVKAQCLAQGLENENIMAGIGGCGTIWGGLMTGERALMAGYKHTSHAVHHETRHRRQVRAKIATIRL
jgi:uncharacterized FAD-dependent dehydrogenase